MSRPLLLSLLCTVLLLACGDRPDLASDAPWNTALDRTRHAYFPIASGAHVATDCNGCHGSFETFTRFSCIGCHAHEEAATVASHGGVAGFTYTETSCIECHPNGEALDVEHARIFPIGAGTDHAGARCAQCHVDPADRRVLGCTTCHGAAAMTTAHAPVGGYVFESRSCIRCHGDAQVDEVSQHLPFLIRSGVDHYRQSCLACHPSFRTDKAFAADFSLPGVSCASCHSRTEMDDKHKSFASYTYAVTSCLQSGCHPDGTKP